MNKKLNETTEDGTNASDLLPSQNISLSNESTDDKSITVDKTSEMPAPIRVIRNPEHIDLYPSKFCTDLTTLKKLLNNHVETFYRPLICLLPEDLQLTLLDETPMAGLNLASCLLIGLGFTSFATLWLLIVRRKEKRDLKLATRLNEHMLILENSLKTVNTLLIEHTVTLILTLP